MILRRTGRSRAPRGIAGTARLRISFRCDDQRIVEAAFTRCDREAPRGSPVAVPADRGARGRCLRRARRWESLARPLRHRGRRHLPCGRCRGPDRHQRGRCRRGREIDERRRAQGLVQRRTWPERQLDAELRHRHRRRRPVVQGHQRRGQDPVGRDTGEGRCPVGHRWFVPAHLTARQTRVAALTWERSDDGFTVHIDKERSNDTDVGWLVIDHTS